MEPSPPTLYFSAEETVSFVQHTILDAIRQGASDIHFEAYETNCRIRFRQDGVLNQVAYIPLKALVRISARIKILSHLDVSERHLPQDGGFKINDSHIRVSTCPTVYGEKIVLRILDAGSKPADINQLGFNALQKIQLLEAIKRPQGMILVTGPTGSGKTLTLYSAMALLNTEEMNLSSVEDPVEMQVVGINQVNINPKMGLDFSTVLRALLRQDPDVIMVGEIRDLETADMAVKAAQTGHLVFSSLHTNSACDTLIRLMHMGVPKIHLSASISLIIAQRLLRVLCPHCKQPSDASVHQELIHLGALKPSEAPSFPCYQPLGCELCHNGYKGRIGVFEVLAMSDALSECFLDGGSASSLLKCARAEGMQTLMESGLAHVKEGLSSVAELKRVLIGSLP